MQLQKRVSLSLIPIISILVIALSVAIWSYIYEQTKRSEIERTWLSFELILVDINRSLTEMDAGLTKMGEYQEVFSLISERDNTFREFALTSHFLEFSYQLNHQVSGFELLSLTDKNLTPLFKSSAEDLKSFAPTMQKMNPGFKNAIEKLHTAMRDNLLNRGAMAFDYGGKTYLLASRVYSPTLGKIQS